MLRWARRPCAVLQARIAVRPRNVMGTHSRALPDSLTSALYHNHSTVTAGRLFSTTPVASEKESTSPALPRVIDLVESAGEALPAQGILENFVHHNPLEHLEHMTWKDALDLVNKQESYMSPGARTFKLAHIDPRKRVNEALSELGSAFLDRGVAKWTANFRDRGFLYFFATLENIPSVARWRQQSKVSAQKILKQLDALTNKNVDEAEHKAVCEGIIQENLQFFGVPRAEWEDCIRSMLLELRGWSGMFRRMQMRQDEQPEGTIVRLLDFCAAQSVLYRASVEAVAKGVGWNPRIPFGTWVSRAPRESHEHHSSKNHTSALAFVDQNPSHQYALEAEFEHAMLRVLGTGVPANAGEGTPKPRPGLQIWTCIDDREGSFRRHVEAADPDNIETFGVAGFFGVMMRYKPVDGPGEMILAPEGQQPKPMLVEVEAKTHPGEIARFQERRKILGNLQRVYEDASFSPLGSVLLSMGAPVNLGRLLMMGYAPDKFTEARHRIKHTLLNGVVKPHTDFELPYEIEQAAGLLASVFKDIGQLHFAPLVVILGHGAASQNNPFHAAYQCGACGGREGGPNARLLARCANDPKVREVLKRVHQITIPDDTFFVGSLHNTTNDTIEYFDLDRLPEWHREAHWARYLPVLENARAENALERCDRFMLARGDRSTKNALQHVTVRATDLAEVRPELNHATNAAVVVGRRSLTQGHFLDRRVFLPSYDPFNDDARGTNLEHVLAPALIVCSGINLEYLFSTTDPEHHGAGTKVPLNVVSNIGVMQGTVGDLRPGLPTQMTEMHVPLRALYVVDSPVDRVEAVLSRRPQLYRLVHNEWVRFFVRDPYTERLYRLVGGKAHLVPAPHKDTTLLSIPFRNHRAYGLYVAHQEDLVYWGSTAAMIASCVYPVYNSWGLCLNPYGAMVAVAGTALALPVLAFSRRYMHGEFMFTRFSTLSVGLLLGFNLVATAPTLFDVMAGWSLFGFASTFLIGAYNERPTVRNNATFAFGVYKISDMSLLVAAAFANPLYYAGHESLVAGGLVLAAMLKSSQFPLQNLFARSMEGPTPASALGYAGLSAHVGVVLLASTMELWFPFEGARLAVAAIGGYTAVFGSIQSKVYSDRKGAIARATSATLGLIYVVLAAGYPAHALLFSFGHALFRMIQILRTPNVISDAHHLQTALGRVPWPKRVPDFMFRFAWILRRFDNDTAYSLIHLLQAIISKLPLRWVKAKGKAGQWALTAVLVILAGAPFTPLSHWFEESLIELLHINPTLAIALIGAHLATAVVLMKTIFLRVLSSPRFVPFHDIGHIAQVTTKRAVKPAPVVTEQTLRPILQGIAK